MVGTATMQILLIAFTASVIVNVYLIFYLRKFRNEREVVVVKAPDVDKVPIQISKPEKNPFQPKIVTPETVPIPTPEMAQDTTPQPERTPPPRPEESVGIQPIISTIPLYPANVNNLEACEHCGKAGLKNKTIHQYHCKKRMEILQ